MQSFDRALCRALIELVFRLVFEGLINDFV